MPLDGYGELIVSSVRLTTDWLRHAMIGVGILGMVTLPVSAQVVEEEGSKDSLASVLIAVSYTHLTLPTLYSV